MLLDVAYVGNHDVGLTVLSDANQALPNALGQNLTLQARRPIQTFSGIEVAFDRGFGSYDGSAGQGGEALLLRALLHQFVHLVEGHR